ASPRCRPTNTAMPRLRSALTRASRAPVASTRRPSSWRPASTASMSSSARSFSRSACGARRRGISSRITISGSRRRLGTGTLSTQDAGDGPAVFVILFLGLIVVGLAAIVEIKFAPPVWLHLLLCTPLILGGAILMLRPLKAALIALQYKHNLLHHDPPRA